MNVKIVLDADGAFLEMEKEVAAGKVVNAELSAITALPGGMEGGGASVAFIGEMEDGRKVFMQTSLRIFQTAAAGFTGKYGDQTGDANFVVAGDAAVVGWDGKKGGG